jgi:hypothetical protein
MGDSCTQPARSVPVKRVSFAPGSTESPWWGAGEVPDPPPFGGLEPALRSHRRGLLAEATVEDMLTWQFSLDASVRKD